MTAYWERYARQRVSRRRMLRAAGVAGAAAGALALAGCGDSKPPQPLASATAPGRADAPDLLNPGNPPRSGGRLVTANPASLGTFDPHTGVAVASAYFPRLYNVLVNQSATRPEFLYMDLAESFEIPDPATFIFKIRPGVRIAPNDLGVPERDMDGEDVRVSLERIKNDATTNNYAFAKDHIDSVRVDGANVIITTPQPYAWFLNRIGLFFNTIVPRELLAGDLSRLQSRAAGGGPYRLLTATEGEQATFSRNPNYYRRDQANNNAQLPYIDNLEVRVIFDRATLRTAFESAQIHYYMTGNGGDARSLRDAVIDRQPNFAYIAFTMNPKRPPFDDPRARRAISRAINRQRYVDLVYDGDARVDGLVQWSLGAYALPDGELASTYQPYDVDEARALVNELGGLRINMMFPADTTVLEHSLHVPIFLEQMRDAGIEVNQDPQAFGTWLDNFHALKYDCSLSLNQLYETPELPLAFHTTNGPFGDKSYIQGIGDPEIDAAVRNASSEMDFDGRVAAVHDAQKIIYAKDPMMLPLVTPYINIAWRKDVKNIPVGIGTSAYLLNTQWLDS